MVAKSHAQDASLGIWVGNQRNLCNKNNIRPDRKRLLDEIGFAWKGDGGNNYDDKLWHQQYEKLVEFKRTNGHCMVPQSSKDDKSLGQWVKNQRAGHANKKILPDRKGILDELGFAWKADPATDKLWLQQYEKLVEFKRKNGHCMVPSKYEQDKSLGRWVQTQRTYHDKDKLGIHRKELLDKIGFSWKANGALTFKPADDKLWHQQYEKLLEYKRKNGHCKVPQTKNKDDKSLADWVRTQRARHANNKMLPARKKLLDKIGFAWKYYNLATRSSITNVRGLVNCIISRAGQTYIVFLTLVLFPLLFV
jgi:hypothetical protein